MTALIVNSDVSLQSAIGDLREAFKTHRFLRVTVKTGMARSLDQNAISHAWYQQMARELREDDDVGHKSYCKLHHGVPILRADDEEFRLFYDAALKGLSYEQKREAMKFVPVTSLMTKPQLSKYLEAVQSDFRTRGVWLEFPQEAAA